MESLVGEVAPPEPVCSCQLEIYQIPVYGETRRLHRLILCDWCYWQLFHKNRAHKTIRETDQAVWLWASYQAEVWHNPETNRGGKYQGLGGGPIPKMPSWLKAEAELSRELPHFVGRTRVIGLSYLRSAKAFLYCEKKLEDGRACAKPVWSLNNGLPIKLHLCEEHWKTRRRGMKSGYEVKRHRERMKDPAYRARWNANRRRYKQKKRAEKLRLFQPEHAGSMGQASCSKSLLVSGTPGMTSVTGS